MSAMSYMIDFPPSHLPSNIRSPPYVIFGIQGEDVSYELPSHVPLSMILHFIPKMKSWVFPPPTKLNPSIKNLTLRKPFVGINILEPIDMKALLFIVNRMLQIIGLAWERENFASYPAVVASCNIVKAWRILDLPVEGIRNLETHLLTRVMLGAALTLGEIKAIWNTFPTTSPILHETAHNFIRGQSDFGYGMNEYSTIQKWIREDKERKKFFASLEKHYKDYSDASTIVINMEGNGTTVAPTSLKLSSVVGITAAKSSEILERSRTQRVTQKERKEREQRDAIEMQRRIRHLRSDASIRSIDTVLAFDAAPTPPAEGAGWDAADTHGADETAEPTKPVDKSFKLDASLLSQAVDGSLLAKALEKYEKGLGYLTGRESRKKKRFPPTDLPSNYSSEVEGTKEV